jgi:hypothetical protein
VIIRLVMAIVLVDRAACCGAGLLVRQGQEGVALGAGEAAAALLVGKEGDEEPGEQQAEEDSERDDGHGERDLCIT